MKKKIGLNSVYLPSEDIVHREISGEFIIIPITNGVGDLEDELFSLNDTGREIWNKLNGKRSLKDVVAALSLEFEGNVNQIEKDVLGLVEELLKRRMLIEVKKG